MAGNIRKPVLPNVTTRRFKVRTGEGPENRGGVTDGLREYARRYAAKMGKPYDESSPEGQEALERAAQRLATYAEYDDLADLETEDVSTLRARARKAAIAYERSGDDEARSPYLYGND